MPAREVGHPLSGAIWLKVNGRTVQEGDLNQLIWKVPEAISYLSGLFRLAAAIVGPDGSYEIALTERWQRRPDVAGTMAFRDPGQLLTIAAADRKGRIATCLESVGAWETCSTVRVTSLEELAEAIKPESISEHGMGGPIVAADRTTLGGEPAVVYRVQAYEYPAHGAEWVTYVAAMHGGRAYILRVWTGRETGITGLDELLAGFRFLG